jgi:hypothetical protein
MLVVKEIVMWNELDTSTPWGMLVSLFATLSWMWVVPFVGLALWMIRSFIHRSHEIRRSNADLFG